MPAITPVSHSPLTTSDITRLPQGAVASQQPGAVASLQNDEFNNSQKSSTLKKTIFGLVVAAAVIVGLKHWGKNSFMKIQDTANMKWYDHLKQWGNKLGEWIEKPFVWAYDKIAGKKVPEAPTA